jgi:hypothetical protein
MTNVKNGMVLFSMTYPFLARTEQITFLIGETAGPQLENPVIKTGCFPKGICVNVVLSAVAGIPS